MSANKYNAITETLRAGMLAPGAVLGDYLAAPPGAFTVPQVDVVTPCPMFGLITDNSQTQLFAINDVPIIKSAGLFSSVADGLAPNSSLLPPNTNWGLVTWTATLRAINNANVDKGAVIAFTFDESNLNRLTDYDVAAQTIAAIQSKLPAYITAGATKLYFDVTVTSGLEFAAYSMAPAWAAANFQLTAQAVVEHTFPMTFNP